MNNKTNELKINELYKEIGNKLYLLRLARGFSRLQISEIVGVTHQQFLKYEKGTNKINLYRLKIAAKFFKKDLSYFYNTSELPDEEIIQTQHQRLCIEVSRNFMKINKSSQQLAISTLIKSLVESQDNEKDY